MSNEITAAQQHENAMISVIERVATDPNADIGKLEKMLDMQERVLNRNAAQSFAADMAAMQAEMPRVFKLAKSHNGNYARLEDINDALRPILQQFGFCVTFRINQQSIDVVTVTAVCSHKLGHSETASMTLPLDKSGSKNGVQAIGSTVSYGKRYAMCALLNISTGDDTNGAELGRSQSKPEAPRIEQKPTISDDGFSAALAKIANGELTAQKLQANRSLTDIQLAALMDFDGARR